MEKAVEQDSERQKMSWTWCEEVGEACRREKFRTVD